HKAHFDVQFARKVDGLPALLINGALKQQLLVHYLYEAFDGRAWPWRLDYRFAEADFVDQRLEVRGKIARRENYKGLDYVHVEAGLWNVDRGLMTTTARCIVIFDPSDESVLAAPPADDLPPHLRLLQDTAVAEDDTPKQLTAQLGSPVEDARSVIPIDLSRL